MQFIKHAAILLLSTSAVLVGCKKESAAPTATQASGTAATAAPSELIVASYDPTREMYAEMAPLFEKHWKDKSGSDIKVTMSHGPSGKQARDIVAGKEADVAALSVDFDIEQIAKAGLIPSDWRSRLPNEAVPYTSTVVFMVRKGNPKNIKDWEDLARDDVEGLAPDPKTGGGARWIYLATWAHGLRKSNGDEAAAREFTKKVYDKAVTDPAMRGSTTRFIQQQTGDVLFGWENEILQVVGDKQTAGQFEIVVPSDSIVIEVPISIVDKLAEKRGTTAAANEFVQYLYSDAGQELAAKYHNRPFNEGVLTRHKDQFPSLTLYRFKEYFKDWPTVMKQHFDAGGELDKMTGK